MATLSESFEEVCMYKYRQVHMQGFLEDRGVFNETNCSEGWALDSKTAWGKIC